MSIEDFMTQPVRLWIKKKTLLTGFLLKTVFQQIKTVLSDWRRITPPEESK